MKLSLKILSFLIISLLILFGFSFIFYLKVLPSLVSNNTVISAVENSAKKYLNTDIDIQNTYLKTDLNGDIEFKAGKISIDKDGENIFFVKDIEGLISLKEAFNKTIVVKKFGADNIFADTDKLLSMIKINEDNKEQKKNDWNIYLLDSVLYINKSLIYYSPQKDTLIKLTADNLYVDNTQKEERYVHFDLNADILRGGKTVNLSIKDDNKVLIKNKQLLIENCPLIINKSKVFFDAWADKNNNFEATVYAKRFFIRDVIKLLKTNVIENNIDDILAIVKDIHGDFDFKIKLTKNNMTGDINFNRIQAKLIPLNNLPFIVNSGIISLNGNNLEIKNFKGFYNNSKVNDFEFSGSVKDYLKTLDTNIDMTTAITNDFIEGYLAKVACIPLTLKGSSRGKLIIKSKNNIFDVILMGKIKKGDDILVDGASFSPINYDRAFKADVRVDGDIINIKDINYYIAKEITRESKGIKPILTLNGNVKADGTILDFGFDIPKPLPSEFLNVLIGQKMFRKGTFSGQMKYDNTGKVPVIAADLSAEKILIPSQRLMLKEGSISTKDNLVNIKADGRYRRCSYNFTGSILNEIKFPIVIKNTELTIDDIDVDRIMTAMTKPVEAADYTKEDIDDDSDDDVAMAFDVKNLIVERCVLKIVKGKYKEINFSNIIANMTLDKDSIFKLKSNRFDIADGISSLDVNCDLKNQKYDLKLGIKDVDSDIMSTAILNLKRQITGKASGIISLNTDESLKLNGFIKFIVKDGTIEKVGLVEYILKFAALFRNPVTMISPSVFSDMVNIPDGSFDKITGDLKLKDNKIELMKIKSYSPTLSAYIVGCYNLENSDAILRIYTKFSNRKKGFAGILRNISLNSLANRIPLNSRNDSNYYAAELEQLPPIEADEKDCQVFLTKVDGDVEHNNFISSLKKIK